MDVVTLEGGENLFKEFVDSLDTDKKEEECEQNKIGCTSSGGSNASCISSTHEMGESNNNNNNNNACISRVPSIAGQITSWIRKVVTKKLVVIVKLSKIHYVDNN